MQCCAVKYSVYCVFSTFNILEAASGLKYFMVAQKVVFIVTYYLCLYCDFILTTLLFQPLFLNHLKSLLWLIPISFQVSPVFSFYVPAYLQESTILCVSVWSLHDKYLDLYRVFSAAVVRSPGPSSWSSAAEMDQDHVFFHIHFFWQILVLNFTKFAEKSA